MDRTFAMVKPDGVQRGLAGEIISRFKNKGIKLTNLFMRIGKISGFVVVGIILITDLDHV